MTNLKNNEIDASPTKDFFINSITKDINLLHVIPDLVDNCLDGARRIKRIDDLRGLLININLNKKYFKISDNCGGIPLKIAKEYAFRFGRDDTNEPIPGSIGLFGVGMKRATFKLGNTISIESKTADEHFVIEIDVQKWKKKPDWKFEYKLINDSRSPNKMKEPGVVIKVTDLHGLVSDEFKKDLFERALSDELETANTMLLEKGLQIILNSKPIGYGQLKLLTGDKLKPAYKKMEIGENSNKVIVDIYAGVAKPSPDEAGWYIFCNGRLVLSADTSKQTGWGEERGNPKYHNYYAYFRGFAFFNSEDTGLLPWDTTKTRINVDSGIYKAVKLEMINLSIPVINFLKKLAKEREKDESGTKPQYQPLNDIMIKTKEEKVSQLRLTEQIFEIPKIEPPQELQPKFARIYYSKEIDKVNKVKKALKVSTNKAVGEKTFEYYLKHGIEDTQ